MANVFVVVTAAELSATLRKAMTLTEVRLASLEINEMLSTIAPSFALQSTSNVRFVFGVLKLLAVESGGTLWTNWFERLVFDNE